MRVAARADVAVGADWLWPLLALPGHVWLALLFVAPLYVVLAIVFGGVDPIFRQPVPVWNPLHWDFTQFTVRVRPHRRPDGFFGPALVRTVVYVGTAEPALPADRLPGGLLHRAVRRAGGRGCCWPR